eukprot:6277871-Amphidinium_carterae.1
MYVSCGRVDICDHAGHVDKGTLVLKTLITRCCVTATSGESPIGTAWAKPLRSVAALPYRCCAANSMESFVAEADAGRDDAGREAVAAVSAVVVAASVHGLLCKSGCGMVCMICAFYEGRRRLHAHVHRTWLRHVCPGHRKMFRRESNNLRVVYEMLQGNGVPLYSDLLQCCL